MKSENVRNMAADLASSVAVMVPIKKETPPSTGEEKKPGFRMTQKQEAAPSAESTVAFAQKIKTGEVEGKVITAKPLTPKVIHGTAQSTNKVQSQKQNREESVFRNSSGYYDPTAGSAIQNADQEANNRQQRENAIAFKQERREEHMRTANTPVMVLPEVAIAKPIKAETELIGTQQKKHASSRLPNVEKLHQSISKVSNAIKDFLHVEDVFNRVRPNIRDKKMYAETWYGKIQNAIYHSLCDYCGIIKDEENNITLPEIDAAVPYLSSLYFFDRIWNTKSMSYEKDPMKIMPKYRRNFADHDGIQPEWIDLFIDRLRNHPKSPQMDNSGIDEVAKAIKAVWCQMIVATDTPPSDSIEEVEEVNVPPVQQVVTATAPVTVLQNPAPEDDDDDPEEELDPEEDYDDQDDENEDSSVMLFSAVVIPDGDFGDVIIVSYGINTIPIHVPGGINALNIEDEIPSQVDDRNGIWDCLIHFAPKEPFLTENPEQYLEGNEIPDISTKVVILDTPDEGETLYKMGGYNVHPNIGCISSEEQWELMKKICYLINRHIGASGISHLERTLFMDDLFKTEEEVFNESEAMAHEHDQDEDPDDNDSNNTEVDLTKVAMASLNGEQGREREFPYEIPEDEPDDERYPSDDEHLVDEHKMDTSVVSIGRNHDDDLPGEGFTFTPRRRDKKNREHEKDRGRDR